MRTCLLVLIALTAIHAADAGPVRVANLTYAVDKTSVCFSDRFLTSVEVEGGIPTEKRMVGVRLAQADELCQFAFAVMNGQEAFTLPEGERANLRNWLERGGFLVASAGCSSQQWSTSFASEMAAIFGEASLVSIPLDHALFRTVFPLTSAPLKGGGNAAFQGVFIGGRLSVLFSREGLNDTEHTQGCCCCGGNEVRNAEEIVANALVYALTE